MTLMQQLQLKGHGQDIRSQRQNFLARDLKPYTNKQATNRIYKSRREAAAYK